MVRATLAAAMLAAPVAVLAAPSPAFQQAILAELAPATRAEVQSRATGGNSLYEVLAVILLNTMQLANATGARVVAVDFGREVAVVEQGGQMRAVNFDSSTLQIRR